MSKQKNLRECARCDKTLEVSHMYLDHNGDATDWCKKCVSTWYKDTVYKPRHRNDDDDDETS
jgi:hypothetical protein